MLSARAGWPDEMHACSAWEVERIQNVSGSREQLSGRECERSCEKRTPVTPKSRGRRVSRQAGPASAGLCAVVAACRHVCRCRCLPGGQDRQALSGAVIARLGRPIATAAPRCLQAMSWPWPLASSAARPVEAAVCHLCADAQVVPPLGRLPVRQAVAHLSNHAGCGCRARAVCVCV